ncbi:MAG: hypothetical protein ABFS32_09940 [Bacteroidota bacterium]
MINLKTVKIDWPKPKHSKDMHELQDYKKHFQLAVINLEQNLIEERMPELKRSA